jgi:hypothetical protein
MRCTSGNCDRVVVSDLSRRYSSNLAKSRFCLVVPGGSTRGVAGVTEAIVHGCVPVIVKSGPRLALPFEQLLKYDNLVIRVREEEVKRLPTVLARITPEKLQKMQEALRCVAPRLLWSSVFGMHGDSAGDGADHHLETGANDAFATLLRALWRLKQIETDQKTQRQGINSRTPFLKLVSHPCSV